MRTVLLSVAFALSALPFSGQQVVNLRGGVSVFGGPLDFEAATITQPFYSGDILAIRVTVSHG